jgi:oxygen-independent coproporphyrinogen-3 oxidase
MARSAEFQRLNVYLIYAIPGQTLESWSRSLEAAITLGTEHISCYGLTYEPNTPITVRKRLGEFIAAEETLELAMLRHTRDRLTKANLPPYEISNYARPGRECLHNLVYWTGGNYIGLGPSAASHIDGWRWKNRPHLREWEEAITAGHLPAADVEQLSSGQRAGELAMLMLRLSKGLDFTRFHTQTSQDARKLFADPIQRFTSTGLLTMTGDALIVTDQGLPVADALASEFLIAATRF